MRNYIAIDMGASHVRMVAGNVRKFDIIRNFETKRIVINGSLFWDMPYIYTNIKEGLKTALQLGDIHSIGIDSWGVDHALLDEKGLAISLPYHYRDSRNEEVMDEVFSHIPQEQLFQKTGILSYSFNTSFQLYAFKKHHPALYQAARYYLSIPDLLNYWLCGEMANELTHASSTQLMDVSSGRWSTEVITSLGLNTNHFLEPTKPKTVLGEFTPALARELGGTSKVVTVASHDSASAVATVRAAAQTDTIFLNSGTWSVIGVVLDQPQITTQAYTYNFTNELSAQGDVRMLKNIMGLWIQEECIRSWKDEGTQISYQSMNKMVENARDFSASIDPTDPLFLKPNEFALPMPKRVENYCKKTGQKVPTSPGEVLVAVYRGLVGIYARTIQEIQEITGRTYRALHIVGGGSRNNALNNMLAESIHIDMYAGPVEATIVGNLLVQAQASGEIQSPAESARYIQSYMESVR